MRKSIRMGLMLVLVFGASAGCAESTASAGHPLLVEVTLEDAAGNILVTADYESMTGSLVVPRNSELALKTRLYTTSGEVAPTQQQTVNLLVTHSTAVRWQGSWDGVGKLIAGPDAGTARLRVQVITLGAQTFTTREFRVEVI